MRRKIAREAFHADGSQEDFDIDERIEELENEMLDAADQLNFELAAMLRDEITALQQGIMPPKGKTNRQKRR
ncbi:MAG: hypothetical protein HOC27_00300 [Phycisphaerae bacterium]|nr:hypothetical protein [Phycisphaerae bacterium]